MFRALSLAAAAGAVVAAVAVFAGATGAAASKAFPEVISLPTGFQPEGLEVGRGNTFYVGSVATGAIYRGNLRTGAGAVFIPGGAGRTATGIELDRFNRLFVAGAGTGKAFVYDARSGALLRTYSFASAPTFINDVVVRKKAAYFTDSQKAVLYRVPLGPGRTLGNAQTVPLSGDFTLASGLNLNGIDATANGKTLVAVQTNTGKLYRIDPNTGVARQISLGGESVTNGDGILLNGRMLYVVRNRDNRVVVIALAASLGSGRVVTTLTDPDFDVPTTLDDHGRRLYAVNARFGTTNPGGAAYQVVQFRKPARG
jgi:sugar lactone lactonase YvrE